MPEMSIHREYTLIEIRMKKDKLTIQLTIDILFIGPQVS